MTDIALLEETNTDIRSRIREASFNYACEAGLIIAAVAIYRFNPYYAGFLSLSAKTTLLCLAATYITFGPVYHFLWGYRTRSKYRTCLIDLAEYLRDILRYIGKIGSGEDAKVPTLTRTSKVTLLFLLVKFYFTPVMINFTANNLGHLQKTLSLIINDPTNLRLLYDRGFSAVMSLIFFVDTIYFVFGYLIEAKALKNEVRSVDPTFIGWAAALACYPPFNKLTDMYIPWTRNETAVFGDPTSTFIARVLIILFTAVYLWATLALGAKCSNLTNRGIVARGPYKYIRHPAYIAKNAAWWIMTLPALTLQNLAGLLGWGFIYYIRAVTEEAHLMKDPDYQEYSRKVKWRFLPRII